MHDDPVNNSKKTSRVGLAIKGASAKDVSRGDIITTPGYLKLAMVVFKLNLIKNPYFKEELSETQNYMISIGFADTYCENKIILEILNLMITFEKPVAYIKNDCCILFSPDSKK